MQSQSKDIQSAIQVTLEDAVRGFSTYIEVQRVESCAACHGTGAARGGQPSSCESCSGVGQWEYPRMVEIKVPAGIDNGSRLRINGEGHSGVGNDPAGNLFVRVMMQDHPLFFRKGANLYCKARVFATRGRTSCVAVIPTLEGKEELIIPDDHRSGEIIRLGGRGMPKLGGGRGDLHVKVWVEPPSTEGPSQTP